MKWKKISLTDFIWFQRGFDLPKDSFINGDFPVVGSTSILGYHIEAKVRSPGIVTGRSGTIGQFQFIKTDFWPHNTSLWVKEFYGNDEKFAYYLLHTLDFISLNGGGAIPSLNRNFLSSINVSIPSLPTQRKIASILSAYDDLIENNLKRIKLLEEQAFLKYKGIVSSEKLKAVQLKDVAVVNESTIKANSNIDKLLYVDIASVSTGSIDNKTEYDLKEAPGRAKRILKHEDIIWSCVRPNRKSYAFVWQPENNLIASTGFAVITSKAIPATFLYQLTTANEFVSYLENHAKGATYPAVTATDFAEALINIPTDSIMQEYHDAVSPCYELKSILQKQNTKLREARDILLPKLMNGQIEV